MSSLRELLSWKKPSRNRQAYSQQQPQRQPRPPPAPLPDEARQFPPETGPSIQQVARPSITQVAGSEPPVITKGRNLGINVLHIPAIQPEFQVDIVFIHGLTGNSYDTWLHRESGVHWPRDLLKHDVPNARILSWGYDADVASFWGHASNNHLAEHARNLLGDLVRLRVDTDSERRAVLFVVHSLGGLVVQRALSISRERAEPHLKSLEAATRGILFMGTPHNGSDLAAWAILCARVVSKFRDANVTILKTLERDSEALRDTQDAFGQLLRIREGQNSPIQVTCFYEEHALTGVGNVVPKSSACLFGYDYYGIPNNHKDMPKFARPSDVGYGRVVGELKRWTKKVEYQQPGGSPTSPEKMANLPPDFKEMLEIIAVKSSAASQQRLDETLSESFSWLWENDSAFLSWLKSSDRLFWVAGKPGSGKTTLMQHIAAHQSRVVVETGTRAGILLAAYFFNSQAGMLERSIEGMLRSLVHQLITQAPALFEKMFPSIRNKSEFRSTLLPWSHGQLESSIRLAVENLPGTRFMFLVDGLDEFGGESPVIARFLRSFSYRLPQNTKVCISSRPYSELQFELNLIPRVLVESHSSNDIHIYITSRLAEVQSILGSDCQKLGEIVAKKADGMFLWVRLAMDSLQRGWRKYEDMNTLTQRLQEMPRDLVDFYQRILNEMDTEDKSEAIRLLVLFSTATDELSSRAFFQAWSHTSNKCMFSGDSNCSSFTTRHLPSEESQDQALRMFEGRVYALTRSLIQVSRGRRDRGPARFFLLHETVQRFIRQRLLGKDQPNLLDRPISGNGLLLHACIHYLDHLFTRNSAWAWEPEPKATKCWSEWETDYFDLGSVYLNYKDYIDRCQEYQWTNPGLYPFEFGFFHYAIRNLLDHARLAEGEPQSNSRIMSTFSGNVFELWRRLYQIHEAGLARTLPVNLLGLAITQGLNEYAEQQILTLPLKQQQPYDYSKDPNYLLFEVARTGSVPLARLLISRGAQVRPTPFDMMKRMDSYPPSPLGTFRHWGEAALPRAVWYDQAEMVTFLLTHGASVVQELSGGFNLGWARSGGIKRCRILSLDAISLSLKRSRLSVSRGRAYSSLSTSSQSSAGGTGSSMPRSNENNYVPYDALHHAISARASRAFTAILPFAQAPNFRESLNAALIQAASENGMHGWVIKLLHHGADATWSRPGFNCLSGPSRRPCYALTAAAGSWNTATIMALLQAGADPNYETPWKNACRALRSHDPHDRSIDKLMEDLTIAKSLNEEELINTARLMLKYGAKIDYQKWDIYVNAERKAELLAMLFPVRDGTSDPTYESPVASSGEYFIIDRDTQTPKLTNVVDHRPAQIIDPRTFSLPRNLLT